MTGRTFWKKQIAWWTAWWGTRSSVTPPGPGSGTTRARDAVCGGRCGAACSCREVQIRLIVRKMKSQFRGQWDRVEAAFKPRC